MSSIIELRKELQKIVAPDGQGRRGRPRSLTVADRRRLIEIEEEIEAIEFPGRARRRQQLEVESVL